MPMPLLRNLDTLLGARASRRLLLWLADVVLTIRFTSSDLPVAIEQLNKASPQVMNGKDGTANGDIDSCRSRKYSVSL
jgi:hypothetical protein